MNRDGKSRLLKGCLKLGIIQKSLGGGGAEGGDAQILPNTNYQNNLNSSNKATEHI